MLAQKKLWYSTIAFVLGVRKDTLMAIASMPFCDFWTGFVWTK